MGLTWRFVVLIAALMGAVAATTVAGLSAMERLDGALDRVVDSDTPRLLAITHVRRHRNLGPPSATSRAS